MRVALVEDHTLFRESLSIALALEGITVVGEAASGRDAHRLAAEKPDVLVLDMMLPDTDGASLVRELRRRRTLIPALIISRIMHPAFVRDALDAGALGYASKDDSLAELALAIRAVGRRERYLSAQVQQAMATAPDDDAAVRLQALSAREREVFCRMLEGLSAKEIARALCVSPKTVYTHRLQINRKLGVHSPAQFARLAAKQGLVV
jgi:DNA-binding NarL/FixJ family response regulator